VPVNKNKWQIYYANKQQAAFHYFNHIHIPCADAFFRYRPRRRRRVMIIATAANI